MGENVTDIIQKIDLVEVVVIVIYMPTLLNKILFLNLRNLRKLSIEKVLADADEFQIFAERFKLEEGGSVPRQTYGFR